MHALIKVQLLILPQEHQRQSSRIEDKRIPAIIILPHNSNQDGQSNWPRIEWVLVIRGRNRFHDSICDRGGPVTAIEAGQSNGTTERTGP